MSPTLTPIGAFPVLLKVMACGALLVVMGWLAKVKLVGDTLAMGAAVPVPVKLMVCGLPAALSAMETEAIRVPVAVGVKVTLRVQFAPAARVEGEMGQLFD